tara:strand:+ start:240 stop:863 length:624 start_codon:yes stop_codon:yes gene_type:complete
MNWIDIVILIILIVSVIWGARTGLFGAALYAVGTIIGWIVGGRVAQMIGSAFGDSLSIDTTVTVIVYILILGASFLLTRSVIKLLKPGTALVDVATLGMNRIVGMVLGLAIGIVLVAVLITAITRFTYDFALETDIAGSAALTTPGLVVTENILAKVDNTKSTLENGLTDSAIAPTIVKILRKIPGNSFGLVPKDFMAALDILDSKL